MAPAGRPAPGPLFSGVARPRADLRAFAGDGARTPPRRRPRRPPDRGIQATENRFMRTSALLLFGVGAVLLADGAILARSPAHADEAKPYTVENGRVDPNTFRGYLYYGENCLRCHGPDGAGSSYAPSLVDSLKTMSKRQFQEVVITGRKNVSQAAANVMPAFGTVPDVVLHLDNIYGYLKARSDGAIGRGRPKRIGESDE
jgi:mono/diheme cytochrome c family protein